jgi:hypothetical protein
VAPVPANPIAADIEILETALSDVRKLVRDVHDGKATIAETFAALDATLKAVAIFYPPAAIAEGYVEAAEGVAALAVAFGLVTTGVPKPIFGGPQPEPLIFGFPIQKD